MLEVRGLEGRGRSPEVEETEILGCSCDGCGRAMKPTVGQWKSIEAPSGAATRQGEYFS